MHEVGVMADALDLALEAAHKAGATRIHRVILRIGALAGVEADALDLAFEVVTAGTLAEGASLEVQAVSVVCHCPGCDLLFEPPDFVLRCPVCQQPSEDVRSGTEMELASVEVS